MRGTELNVNTRESPGEFESSREPKSQARGWRALGTLLVSRFPQNADAHGKKETTARLRIGSKLGQHGD